MKRLKTKYVFLVIVCFLFSAAPLAAALVLKRNAYFADGIGNTVSFGAGLASIAFLNIRSFIQKKREISGVEISCWTVVLSFLMKQGLADLPLLSVSFLIGRLIVYIFFETALERTRALWYERKEKKNE